ncbi:hypothetical protein RCL1_004269 [Eukaryota sp. TZLM3-RCL]
MSLSTAPITLQRTERAIKFTFDPKNNSWSQSAIIVQIDPQSFSEGNLRVAHHLKDFSVQESDSSMVAKFPKKDRPLPPRVSYFRDVECQMIAAELAEAFNSHNPPKKISFLPCFVLELCDRPGRPLCCCEPFTEGIFTKHNNNYGYVSPEMRSTPQAFSHFSLVCTNEELMVVDIQGVGDIYTDPQIHSSNGKDFGLGNLGRPGIDKFLSTHNCNEVCKLLKLPKVGNYVDSCATVVNIPVNEKKVCLNSSFSVDQSDLIEAVRQGALPPVQKLIVWCNIEPANVIIELNRSLLHLAASLGHYEVLNFLLKSIKLIDYLDDNGESPLFLACRCLSPDCAQILIENGANFLVKNLKGETLFGNVIENDSEKSFEFLQFLFSHPRVQSNLIEVSKLQHKSQTLLTTALSTQSNPNQSKIIDLLLSSSFNINDINDCDGFSALSHCCHDLNLLKSFVFKGAKCNIKSKNNTTLLFLPNLSSEVVRFLVLNGVDLSAVSNDGQTAFSTAIKRGDVSLAKLLMTLSGQNQSKEELNSLLLSVSSLSIEELDQNHDKVIDFLIDLGADVNYSEGGHLETPFVRCILSHHVNSSLILLNKGAQIDPDLIDHVLFLLCSQPHCSSLLFTVKWVLNDLNPNPTAVFGSNGENCLDVALLGGSCEVAGVIFEKYSDSELILKKLALNSNTLLSTIVYSGLINTDVIDFLVHLLGANPNSTDSNGIPLLSCALLSFNHLISKKLIEVGAILSSDVALWTMAYLCCGVNLTGVNQSIKRRDQKSVLGTITILTHDLNISPFDCYPHDDPLIDGDLVGLPFFIQSILTASVEVLSSFSELGVECDSEMRIQLISASIERSLVNSSAEESSALAINHLCQSNLMDPELIKLIEERIECICENGLIKIFIVLSKNFGDLINQNSRKFKILLAATQSNLIGDSSRLSSITEIMSSTTLTSNQIFELFVNATSSGSREFCLLILDYFSKLLDEIPFQSIVDLICFLARKSTNLSVLSIIFDRFKIDPKLTGNADVIQSFLKQSIPTITTEATSPLFEAVNNSFEAVKLLIDFGYDVNITDSQGNTLLHQSIVIGNDELSCFLVSSGLDIHTSNKFGISPFSIAPAELKQKLLMIIESKKKKIVVNNETNSVYSEYFCAMEKFLKNSTEISSSDKKQLRGLRKQLGISANDHEKSVLECGWSLEEFEDGEKE